MYKTLALQLYVPVRQDSVEHIVKLVSINATTLSAAMVDGALKLMKIQFANVYQVSLSSVFC